MQRISKIIFLTALAALSVATTSCGPRPLSNKQIVDLLLSEPDEDLLVIDSDKPWDWSICYASIATNDEGKHFLYYRVTDYDSPTDCWMCYATSDDGIHWDKPEDNRITPQFTDGIDVIYKDGLFYLLVNKVKFENGERLRTLSVWTGKDGIHFERDTNFVFNIFCDTQNQILWDETTQTWKFYLRSWYKSDVKTIDYNVCDSMYRAVNLFETPDLNVNVQPGANCYFKWADKAALPDTSIAPRVLQNPSTDTDFDIYFASVHKYSDDLYIAYPCNFYHTPDTVAAYPEAYHHGKLYYNGKVVSREGYESDGFWTSDDGRHFTEVVRDYVTNGHYLVEFVPSHIETPEAYIHYYIPVDATHANCDQVKNCIRARIHYKSRARKK